MYQFTTNTILNTAKDENGADRVISKATQLSVSYVGNFKTANVENKTVYKTAASDPVMPVATISITDALAKAKKLNASFVSGTFRVNLYIRLQGSQNSLYANDFVFKGRPLYIEAEYTADDTAATLADKFIANAKKYALTINQDAMVTLTSATATDVTTLTITGTSEYQVFTTATLEYYNTSAGILVGGYTQGEWETATTGTVSPQGKEGFGTYQYMIKNVQLPTATNTSWLAINRFERPIVGGKYSQYILKYCVNRGIMGADAVGVPVKSITTHIFWVESALVTAFEAALTTAKLTITAIPDTTQDASLEDDTAVDLENKVGE